MKTDDHNYIYMNFLWANASNTPFRMFKHWAHEGGISSPLIVHWPQHIKESGEFRNQPGQLMDIMATCVDVAEANYPGIFNNRTETVNLAAQYPDKVDAMSTKWMD